MVPEPQSLNRRSFLRIAALFSGSAWLPWRIGAAEPASSPFQQRGYYITFMRMPAYGLAQWKQILECLKADEANLLLLWMGGAFRSKKYPVTWKFNEEHENVRADFGRELIAHAHRLGLKVLLGFTPFGYDGVNQYPLEHPELKALKQDGRPADRSGIYCWGWNLCPSKPAAQQFLLEYVREMYFEFYPEADGLMIESSDYAICYCPDCRGHFFEKEFQFVEAISREAWVKKPDSMIVVYPHYFSGAKVPGFETSGATMKFDPRWTLFFTPHSAHLDARLIKQARSSLWWDESPALHGPGDIQRGARRAREAGVTGYVPSLEAYSFIPAHPEEGQKYLVGRRQVPLGFGWLKPDQQPYGELLMRVNRLAYREFSRQPDLNYDEFKARLGQELFADASTAQAVEDLLALQRIFQQERSWCQVSPLADPARVRAMKAGGKLTPAKIGEYRAALAKAQAIAERYRASRNAGLSEMHRIAQWLVNLWQGAEAELLGQ